MVSLIVPKHDRQQYKSAARLQNNANCYDASGEPREMIVSRVVVNICIHGSRKTPKCDNTEHYDDKQEADDWPFCDTEAFERTKFRHLPATKEQISRSLQRL